MRISIINGDGTTTYTDTLVQKESSADFSAELSTATDSLNATGKSTSSASSTSASSTSTTSSATTSGYTSTTQSVPSDLLSIFKEASETYGVDINLLTAIARQESNFHTDATSSSGAMGVMQLMPATAAGLGVSDAYDAYQNIMGGSKYISQLLSKYDGDVSLALAAYNAGSGNVAKYGGIPPFKETQNYVTKVLGYYQENTSGAATNTSASSGASSSTSATNDASKTNNTSTLRLNTNLTTEERNEIYRQMLSLTNQLIADKL